MFTVKLAANEFLLINLKFKNISCLRLRKRLVVLDGKDPEFKNISCLRLSNFQCSIKLFSSYLKTFHVYG